MISTSFGKPKEEAHMLLGIEIKKIFSDANAIIPDDHFVYAKKIDGWYHGHAYVNKDAICPHIRALSVLCREIAIHFYGQGIEVIVGPTVGGVALAQWVAHYLDAKREVLAVYADEEDVIEEMLWLPPDKTEKPVLELSVHGALSISVTPDFRIRKITSQVKTGTRRVLKRGYDKIVSGKRCLIVEDVINSGLTVEKTIKAVNTAGGIVVGVGCLCNRSGGRVNAQTLAVPELFSLLDLDMQMFREEDCQICKERGIESVRTDLGKGKEFLARMGKA